MKKIKMFFLVLTILGFCILGISFILSNNDLFNIALIFTNLSFLMSLVFK